jgi:hypothetical protein
MGRCEAYKRIETEREMSKNNQSSDTFSTVNEERTISRVAEFLTVASRRHAHDMNQLQIAGRGCTIATKSSNIHQTTVRIDKNWKHTRHIGE